jgi:hypothetical protein
MYEYIIVCAYVSKSSLDLFSKDVQRFLIILFAKSICQVF